MYGAYGSLCIVKSIINGLKSVVTKWFEPTALFDLAIRFKPKGLNQAEIG